MAPAQHAADILCCEEGRMLFFVCLKGSCLLLLAFCNLIVLHHWVHSHKDECGLPLTQEPMAGAREATLNAIKSRQFALKPVHKSEDRGVRAKVTSA